MKTSPDLAQALTNLRASTDFKTVLDFIVSERSIARDECESHTALMPLYKAQGRAAWLKDFLKMNEKAPEDLEKFKSNRQYKGEYT